MQYLDATASRRCRMRFASLPYFFVLLVAFTVLTIVGILDHSERARSRQESRAHVLDHLSAKRAKLEGALNERLFLTQGLAAHVSTRPKLSEAEFEEIAQVIVAGHTGIRAIQLAKGYRGEPHLSAPWEFRGSGAPTSRGARTACSRS